MVKWYESYAEYCARCIAKQRQPRSIEKVGRVVSADISIPNVPSTWNVAEAEEAFALLADESCKITRESLSRALALTGVDSGVYMRIFDLLGTEKIDYEIYRKLFVDKA